MADNLAKLVVRLEAQNSQYIKTLEASEKKMQGFQRTQMASLKQIQQGFTKFGALIQGGGFLIAFRLLANNLERVAEKFKDVDPAARAAATAFKTMGETLDKSFLAILKELNPLLDKFNQYMDPAAVAARDLEGATELLAIRERELNEALKNGASERSAYVKSLRDRYDAQKKITEQMQAGGYTGAAAADDAKRGGEKEQNARFGDLSAASFIAGRKLRMQAMEEYQKKLDAFNKETAQLEIALNKEVEDEKLQAAKEFADQMAAINRDRVQEGVDQEERTIEGFYEDIAKKAKIADDAYQGVMEADKEVNDRRREQFEAQTQAFGDLFVDNMVQAADSGFAAVLESWTRTLQQMVLKAAGMQLFQGVFGGATGWLAEVGNILGGGKAAGGPVAAGMPYMVGERGPEMFIPSSAGRIDANGNGRGVAIVQNIDARGATDPGRMVLAMKAAKNAAVIEIRNLQKRGR